MTRDAFDKFAPLERGRFGDNEHGPRRADPERAMRISGTGKLIDLTLYLRHDGKPAAIAVIPPDKVSTKWIWLPRSLIEFVRKGGKDSALIEVTLPEWLAVEKGLV